MTVNYVRCIYIDCGCLYVCVFRRHELSEIGLLFGSAAPPGRSLSITAFSPSISSAFCSRAVNLQRNCMTIYI